MALGVTVPKDLPSIRPRAPLVCGWCVWMRQGPIWLRGRDRKNLVTASRGDTDRQRSGGRSSSTCGVHKLQSFREFKTPVFTLGHTIVHVLQ